jgi:purine-binding chemotaxis protein CheW
MGKFKEEDGAKISARDELPTSQPSDKGGKFLTFFLSGEEYGIEILKVHEIIRMMPITSVPRTESYTKGVINLRGKVIPVVDLRLKLSMASTEQTDETCIIVVQANRTDIGIIVDRVSEVLDILNEDIENTPSFGASVNSDYILGIGKSEGRIKILLDIDKVLTNTGIVDVPEDAWTEESTATKLAA